MFPHIYCVCKYTCTTLISFVYSCALPWYSAYEEDALATGFSDVYGSFAVRPSGHGQLALTQVREHMRMHTHPGGVSRPFFHAWPTPGCYFFFLCVALHALPIVVCPLNFSVFSTIIPLFGSFRWPHHDPLGGRRRTSTLSPSSETLCGRMFELT